MLSCVVPMRGRDVVFDGIGNMVCLGRVGRIDTP